MLRSLRHNLRNLLAFSGRDDRGLFWPWAITVFVVAMLVDCALMVPMIVDMMRRISSYAEAHPEGLPTGGPGAAPLPPELMPDFAGLVAPMAVVNLLAVLLWAAAVVRRLHDTGRSGWWGAIVLPFQLVSLLLGPAAARTALTGTGGGSPLATAATFNTAAYWLAFLALLVLLVGNGTPGPNRYGEAPAA